MRVTKVLIIITLLAMLAPSALAASDEIFINPVNTSANQIFYWETATFELRINNNQLTDQVYTWSVSPVEWVMDSTSSIKVDAGETESVNVLIRPKPSNFRGPGVYEIPFTITNNQDDTSIRKIISINIKSTNTAGLEYLPSVALGASTKDDLDPREPINVQVGVRNRNIRNLDNVEVEIEAEHFTRSDDFALSGLEEKTINYRFNIDEDTPPGQYDLTVSVIFNNGTIAQVQDTYEIATYSDTRRDLLEQKKLFQKTQILEITNEANIERSIPAELQIPWYESIFTSIDVEADDYERTSRKKYTFNLGPYESVEMTIHQNYTALPVIGILIIAAIIIYFMIRSPIVLQKQIIVTGKDDEGTSEMKVRVYVRNRTAQSFYNLRVIDKAPSIAHVMPPSGLGVMEPNKIITTEKKGTIIKWDFDTLEAYEERIVTYTVQSKLKIIGNLGLPAVKIKFENAKGTSRTTESGKAFIGRKR